MSAGIIMIRHGPDAERFSGPARAGVRPCIGAWQRSRSVIRRIDAGFVVFVGFAAAMGWAFVGSLLFSLGTGSTSRATAMLWLAGELLIGAAVFVALLLDVPHNRDGA